MSMGPVSPNIPVKVPADGSSPPYAVPVSITEGGGSGGTADADLTSFVVGTTPGTPIMGVVNPVDIPANGKLAVAALDSSRRLQIAGTLSSTPVQSNTANVVAQTAVGAAASTILAANAARKCVRVQNTGTTILYLGLGKTPTITQYHLALPACGVHDDGSSQPWVSFEWIGAIQAISSAAGGTCVVTEET